MSHRRLLGVSWAKMRLASEGSKSQVSLAVHQRVVENQQVLSRKNHHSFFWPKDIVD